MADKIKRWKEDDMHFIERRATKHVISCLKNYSCVSVIGPSGCGKTSLVRHVAIQLEKDGYTILNVTNPKKMKDDYKSERKTLYIVDDICGNFTANQNRIEKWKEATLDIEDILKNDNCKLLLACRLHVFQDEGFTNLKIFKTCECNLRSPTLSLTFDEKEKMTNQYFKEYAVEALTQIGNYDFLPLLCKLYFVEKKNSLFSLKMFLKDPFSFYEYELTGMYCDCKEGKYKYCALLLLVIFNNKLEGNIFKGDYPKLKEVIEDIRNACDLDENLSGKKLKNQFKILEGTFVTYEEGIYRTIHDKLFDFLSLFFGNQKQMLDILIKHAKDRFVRERFVVTKNNESTDYSILIPDDKLDIYIKRVFDDIVSSCRVKNNIVGNTNFKNAKFRTMFLDLMKDLPKNKITSIMEKANADFLNTMFVMKKNDIRLMVECSWDEYKCFGIILPDDMLQQYISKWFEAFIKIDNIQSFVEDNRLLSCSLFRTALNSYMRKLSPENIAVIIQNASGSFLNTMFEITDHDIKGFARAQITRLSIVIPEGMSQQYIDRWFDCLKKAVSMKLFMDDCRYVVNFTLRSVWNSYLIQLSTETIASVIEIANHDFINKIFVMAEVDIKPNVANECIGIVIPVSLLQKYIERWFEGLTKIVRVKKFIEDCRPFANIEFRTALCTYMRQLTTEQISDFIQTANTEFFDLVFVMTELDIKDKSMYLYECFGIVIPLVLLPNYIEKYFDFLTNHVSIINDLNKNRVFKNVQCHSVMRTYMKTFTNEKIASFIQNAGNISFHRLFVMTEDDIKVNAEKTYECIGIVLPDDLLEEYIERFIHQLTKSFVLEHNINENRLLKNIAFRTALRTHMKQFTKEKIASIIQNSDIDFIILMFVMTEEDIKDTAGNQYECIGIVIPDDLLEHYIERFLHAVTIPFSLTSLKYDIKKNRLLKNIAFRTALRTHMKQLPTERIASIIQTSNINFFYSMFVITEEDIKDNIANQYECLSIVISEDLLEKYIERFVHELTKPFSLILLRYDIKNNRCWKNIAFRTALRTQMKQFTKEKIASIIQTSDINNINLMFVMTEEDIKDTAENQYECIGIVIPDDLKEYYIERWIYLLSDPAFIVGLTFDENRPFMNVEFRSCVHTYIENLHTETIASLIQNSNKDFINLMFVMTNEKLTDYIANMEKPYRCVGIVIPDNLLQRYIERWFDDFTQLNFSCYCPTVKDFIHKNRPLMNVTFRTVLHNYIRQLHTKQIETLIQTADFSVIDTLFVMAEDDIKDNDANLYECLSIVIPYDLLEQYIERLVDEMTESVHLKDFIINHRPLQNVAFRAALRTHIRQLTTTKIASIIQTSYSCFFNLMFVMTDDDIKYNDENRYEDLGIVIPDDLLEQYIEKLFDRMTNPRSLKDLIINNRPLKNVTFRTALHTYIRQLETEQIAALIQNGSTDFVNRLFVMTEDDIKENAENRYECIGIVIPDCLLEQYITKWFGFLNTVASVKQYMNENRCLMNDTFRTLLRTMMKRENTKDIASFISNARGTLLNTIFVMTEDDIKDSSENLYECYGTVIHESLLQLYIEKWFAYVTHADSVMEYINENRPFNNVTFRTAFCTFLRQLKSEKIGNLIETGSSDFVNTMFVMTGDDIKEYSANRFKCVGIVIPVDLLNQHIERWFDCLTKSDSVNEFIKYNRCFMHVTFRTALDTYVKQINSEKIEFLNKSGNIDFLNTMFQSFESDKTNEI